MNIRKSIILFSLATAIGSPLVYSLPDATQGNPLSDLGLQIPSGVGDVVRDHEDTNTLHVGPASTKEIMGVFSEFGGSGARCDDLNAIQAQAYRLPKTDEMIKNAIENGEFISNWFQLSVALPADNLRALRQIKEAKDEASKVVAANAKATAEFLRLDPKWKDLNARLSNKRTEYELIDDKKRNETSFCIRNFFTDPPKLVACVQKAAQSFQTVAKPISEEIARLTKDRSELSNKYHKVKVAYDHAARELKLINSDIRLFSLIFDGQKILADSAFNLEKRVIETETGRVSGRATAGYSLFGNEVSLLSNTLAGRRNFQIKQLDVFNVRLHSGITASNPTVSTDNGAILYSRNVLSYPSNTLFRSGLLSEWSMPFDREHEGDTITFDAMDKNTFGSGGVSFLVSKGARCGEYKAPVVNTYSHVTRNGDVVNWNSKHTPYESKPNRTAFSESIGLTYNYYAFPGELRGECSIDVDKMHTYWRTAGQSKKWQWFNTKTNRWSDIKQEAKYDMGMECKLDLKPLSTDFEEARRLEEQFERHMHSDMWQMFLSVYAKDYEVDVIDQDVPDLEKSTVGNTLGTGVMKICGPNVTCQFGGVVLKALDEIGGSKAQGSTSLTSRNYGKIWKRYNKNTFALKEGHSSINMKVCLDRKRCS